MSRPDLKDITMPDGKAVRFKKAEYNWPLAEIKELSL